MTEPSLELQALLAEAQQRTGLDDFGDPAFLAPFERLLRSLREEAQLNAIGRAMQFERNVGLLVNRLRTEDHYRRHPEIEQEQIDRPLVIVGLARTGTTMLHRMMASDPRWLALLWYESRNPAPFPGAGDALGDTDPRITDAEAEVAAMLEGSPDLIAAHPMDAHAPDEEIMLVEHAFTSWDPEAFCRVPGYSAYLDEIDLAPGYRYLRRLLRFLQWQKHRRGETATRWVLKAPYHLGSIEVLFDTFPDARIAMTHRDPVQTVPSFASLARTLRVLGSDSVDPVEIGAHWSRRWSEALERAIAARASREERFLDVYYEDLVADPMAQVRRIYTHAGVALTFEAEASMRRWAVENERDRRPVHAYTLEEFGYTREGLRRDFAAYWERFLAGRSPD
jgi:Sulfotransferase family